MGEVSARVPFCSGWRHMGSCGWPRSSPFALACRALDAPSPDCGLVSRGGGQQLRGGHPPEIPSPDFKVYKGVDVGESVVLKGEVGVLLSVDDKTGDILAEVNFTDTGDVREVPYKDLEAMGRGGKSCGCDRKAKMNGFKRRIVLSSGGKNMSSRSIQHISQTPTCSHFS